jgi:threonyl-tRNA synthetase
MVLGDNELETEKANLKNMENGEITEVSLENLSEDLFSAVNSSAFDMLADSILKEQTNET